MTMAQFRAEISTSFVSPAFAINVFGWPTLFGFADAHDPDFSSLTLGLKRLLK
jgi:hypothetical protein